nr:hypothetical protein [uncultured Undibacterium sp.]
MLAISVRIMYSGFDTFGFWSLTMLLDTASDYKPYKKYFDEFFINIFSGKPQIKKNPET